MIFQNAKCCILMGDINQKSSFESCQKWLDSVWENTSLRASTPIPIVLVGNKCDLIKTQKEVKELESWIKAKAEEHGIKWGMLVSSKDGYHLEEVM